MIIYILIFKDWFLKYFLWRFIHSFFHRPLPLSLTFLSTVLEYHFHLLWASFLTPRLHTAPLCLICLSQLIIILSLSPCPPASTLLTGFQIRKHTSMNKQKIFHFKVGERSWVMYLQGTKALPVSLATNTSMPQLNLRDNWMEGMGGSAVAWMMKENVHITGGRTKHSNPHTVLSRMKLGFYWQSAN